MSAALESCVCVCLKTCRRTCLDVVANVCELSFHLIHLISFTEVLFHVLSKHCFDSFDSVLHYSAGSLLLVQIQIHSIHTTPTKIEKNVTNLSLNNCDIHEHESIWMIFWQKYY